MTDVFGQPGAGVRFDWGPAGAAGLGRECAVLVVVDVLSFSTSTDVAVGRGIRIHPAPWDARAASAGIPVAVGRSAVTSDRPWSLSPAALLSAPAVPDLVLPSPNGSAICAAAASTGVRVIAGCVRNAAAVARWLREHGYGVPRAPVGVIAAGERWPDGTLRPCVEDLLGAAMVLAGLSTVEFSVEAFVAKGALVPDVPAAIRACVSGRELIDRGFGSDVDLAVEAGGSDVVPLLVGDAFVAAPSIDG